MNNGISAGFEEILWSDLVIIGVLLTARSISSSFPEGLAARNVCGRLVMNSSSLSFTC